MNATRRFPVRRLIAVVPLLVLAIGPAASAQTTEVPRAAVNGWARGSAAFVPFAVNPNFDFWPVYSFSEMNTTASHGVSAGFWPGFLVDATFFQFGYQPFERAVFGVAESLWPNPPLEDDASTFDFAELCAAGEDARIAFPFNTGDAGFPEPLLTGCQSLWAQYERFWPYEGTRGVTASDQLSTAGTAKAFATQLGDVTIGDARSSSSTKVVGDRTVSRAVVVLKDVAVGQTLHIGSIISVAQASSDGTAAGLRTTRRFTITDARYQDTAVEITDEGVVIPGQDDLNEELAKEGFEVRLIDGDAWKDKTDKRSHAEAGALVIRATRPEAPEEIVGVTDEQCRATSQLRRDAFDASGLPDPIATPSANAGENPLHDNVFPYDQLPQELEVQEVIPPSIPCLGLLLQRSADIGVVLGGAVAEARFLPLPAIPDFDPGDFDFGPIGGGPLPTGGFGEVPPGGFSGLIPSYEEVPPVPGEVLGGFGVGVLGEDVAARVRLLYAAIAVMVVIGLTGRRVFRSLIRL